MSETILVALITGGLSLAGVFVSSARAASKTKPPSRPPRPSPIPSWRS